MADSTKPLDTSKFQMLLVAIGGRVIRVNPNRKAETSFAENVAFVMANPHEMTGFHDTVRLLSAELKPRGILAS